MTIIENRKSKIQIEIAVVPLNVLARADRVIR
jgi:hypothetical protein